MAIEDLQIRRSHPLINLSVTPKQIILRSNVKVLVSGCRHLFSAISSSSQLAAPELLDCSLTDPATFVIPTSKLRDLVGKDFKQEIM
jgi:hypothetical protein